MVAFPKVDCLTILLKNEGEADLFRTNHKVYGNYLSFKNCVPVLSNGCIFEVLSKISFEDIIKNLYFDKVFHSSIHTVNFLFTKLTLNDLSLLHHVEIAVDLKVDFNFIENKNLQFFFNFIYINSIL